MLSQGNGGMAGAVERLSGEVASLRRRLGEADRIIVRLRDQVLYLATERHRLQLALRERRDGGEEE